MKIELEIQEDKAAFFLELLKNFKFVKVRGSRSLEDERILAGIKEGVQEVKLARQGKIKLKTAQELLDEL